ncbi:hypothetical protein [Levilactobacillus namurensis]|uniref:hypothetical protein n=1 Tax=Levilactobacillus namurensis TaxID=380393 RepID=UPI0026ED57B5|nr:hypothetical protein [Levilactobacillus namurensis]
MAEWVPAEKGQTIGQLGTEDGVIIKDEEWPGIGRITLEQKRTGCAITCGLYGSFFLTTYMTQAESDAKYVAMKAALAASPDDLEELEVWIDKFVHRFQ